MERPNRFIVHAQLKHGELVRAHCPNPGRMRELLLPGQSLILEQSQNPHRATQWSLAAVQYKNQWIPLHASRANGLMGDLFLPMLFPTGTHRPEVTRGKARMDWKVEEEGQDHWIEVKACTLVERGVALFPDAPSLRAVKHLKELIPLGNHGRIIIAIMNPEAMSFSPNPHTDPTFCRTLLEAAESGIQIHAVSIRCDEMGWAHIVNPHLPVNLSTAKLAQANQGVVLRFWQKLEHHHVTVEVFESSLTKGLARRPKQTGWKLNTSLAICGSVSRLKSLPQELDAMGYSAKKNPITNPLQDPLFLDWFLQYRHERVFQGFTNTRPV